MGFSLASDHTEHVAAGDTAIPTGAALLGIPQNPRTSTITAANTAL